MAASTQSAPIPARVEHPFSTHTALEKHPFAPEQGENVMTEMELVTRSKKLYEQILSIAFAPEEMLAFGRAVFTKTPWRALTAAGKLAMFRLTAAFALTDQVEQAPAEEALPPDAAEEPEDPPLSGASDGGATALAGPDAPDGSNGGSASGSGAAG
jgi:hypothetical protein